MRRNLEIKAHVDDLSSYEKICISLGALLANDFVQIDTYFNVRKGRLKLREFDNVCQLIYYERDESSEKRWSSYQIVEISECDKVRQILERSLGVKVVVEKQRKVYLYKNARIHLDKVRGLGNFVEFEVIHNGDDSRAEELLEFLLEVFKLKGKELIKVSYSDLFEKQRESEQ